MHRALTPAMLSLASLIAGPAGADVTIGWLTFDDSAFVDAVGAVQGSWTLDDGANSVPDAIVGPDTDGRTWSTIADTFVEILFEDNVVFNGEGEDLAVFESGVLDLIAVEIDGISVVRDSVFTGDVTPTRGYDVNVATFDLSEFEIPVGGSVSSVRILGGFERDGTVAAYTVAGAINVAAPCPADLDGSGAVDFADLLRVLDAWGNKGGPEDLDASGVVDFGDLLIVLDSWGPCE